MAMLQANSVTLLANMRKSQANNKIPDRLEKLSKEQLSEFQNWVCNNS